MNAEAPDLPPMSCKEAYIMLWRRRTTIWGYVVAVAGALCAAGVFPEHTAKWILPLIGLATAGLGHFNAAQIKRQSQEPSK